MDFVAELTRSSWHEVYSLTALQFLTLICYGKDKAEHEAREKEKYLRTH